jgi:hypothetical protein
MPKSYYPSSDKQAFMNTERRAQFSPECTAAHTTYALVLEKTPQNVIGRRFNTLQPHLLAETLLSSSRSSRSCGFHHETLSHRRTAARLTTEGLERI